MFRDGVRVADSEVRSRKARTLLKFLAVERASLVPIDRIAEVLWAGAPLPGREETSPRW